MNLCVLLQAAPAAGVGSGFLSGGGGTILMMVAMFAIIYFFMIRPQNKKQKEIQNFRKGLEVGQKVITAGGIHGKIKELRDDAVILEIADNVRIKIDKNSIFAAASDASQANAK